MLKEYLSKNDTIKTQERNIIFTGLLIQNNCQIHINGLIIIIL